MNKVELIVRRDALIAAINESAANHNLLIGRLEEIKFVIEQIEKSENQM